MFKFFVTFREEKAYVQELVVNGKWKGTNLVQNEGEVILTSRPDAWNYQGFMSTSIEGVSLPKSETRGRKGFFKKTLTHFTIRGGGRKEKRRSQNQSFFKNSGSLTARARFKHFIEPKEAHQFSDNQLFREKKTLLKNQLFQKETTTGIPRYESRPYPQTLSIYHDVFFILGKKHFFKEIKKVSFWWLGKRFFFSEKKMRHR